MTPYHRLISAWVLLEKQKDIPKYLERLGLPEPETLPELVKKPTRDEMVSRFCRWFSGAEMDHDIDIVYYRLLPVVGTRKTLNTLLLLGYTPEALSQQLVNSHRLPVVPEIIRLYSSLCWDTALDYHILLRTARNFREDESAAYLKALTGTQWEAEITAGVVPNVAVKSLLKMITAAGYRAINQLLKTGEYEYPERVVSLALKAADMLKDMEATAPNDVAEALAFELELVKEDTDPSIQQLQLDLIDTNSPQEVGEKGD